MGKVKTYSPIEEEAFDEYLKMYIVRYKQYDKFDMWSMLCMNMTNDIYEYKEINVTANYFIKQNDNYFYYQRWKNTTDVVLYVRDEGKNVWEKYLLVSTVFDYKKRNEITEFIEEYERNKR